MSGEELRRIFAGLGLRDVATFRTSGNVVFAAPREARGKLTERLERGLAAALGWESAVFLRTAAEVEAIAAARPFDAKRLAATEGRLQVALLARRPPARRREETLALATDEDLLAFGERELYWLPRAGISDSELDLDAIERLAGPTTMRTMGTIERLAEKHLG